ncbi:class I SAM-dependent RNA methyltransferase [Candidatus Peregrinibacteria bacterium]|nr:MAG: class I SAM-dependent RNA methyltransferase [Candidatus Peregrinibacteria bacterium]
MAEKMHQYVRGLIEKEDTKGMHLLDLYGGVGTFGILNADQFESVWIVEGFQGCIDSALVNIKKNHITNAQAKCMDAKNLKRLKIPKPLFVITDPPRAGMDPRTVREIIQKKPEHIIYISCNVEQLRKDLPKFLKKYELKSAAIFDLFPQTNHMESVVELKLANQS